MSKNLLKILLLVASFTVYYVVISPLYTGVGSVWQPSKGITALRTENVQYDDTLSQAETLLQDAKTLKTKYEAISPDTKDKLALMVPSKEVIDPVRLVSEVSSIAQGAGLSVSELSYSEGNTVGNRGTYTVSFSVKTTYTKFKELMHNYETSLRLFSIQSVQFSVSDSESSIIPFQVRMETYYIK